MNELNLHSHNYDKLKWNITEASTPIATLKIKWNSPRKSNRQLAKSLSPTIDEVVAFFQSKGYKVEAAKKFFEYYDSADWKDSNGKPVKNWKQKAIGVWFKAENAEVQTTIAGMNINDVNNFLKR